MSTAITNLQLAVLPLTAAQVTNIVQQTQAPEDRQATLGQLADAFLQMGLLNGDFSIGALGSIYADSGAFTTNGLGGMTCTSVVATSAVYTAYFSSANGAFGGIAPASTSGINFFDNTFGIVIATLSNAGSFTAAQLSAQNGFSGTLAAAIAAGKSVSGGIILN